MLAKKTAPTGAVSYCGACIETAFVQLAIDANSSWSAAKNTQMRLDRFHMKNKWHFFANETKYHLLFN